jgi:colanic acid/amylovoran biosynthesis glycosyltransferase
VNLGVLIPQFPTQTHVFFWREIQALRELGVAVHLFSTRRPAEGCPHAFGGPAAAETRYLFPPEPGAVLDLLRDGGGLRRAADYVLGVSERGLRRLRVAALVPSAAELASHARRLRLDHLHVHSCADAAHVAALARLLGGPPYSLRLHGDLAAYGTSHAQKARLATFVAAAAAPFARQAVAEAGVPADRAFTLPMGIDAQRFRPRPARARPAGPLRLVTVARLTEGKGHRFVLEAMRALADRGVDLEYAIVGDGPDRARIEREIARQGLEGRVHLHGSLGEEEVRAQLGAADAFVLPSVAVGEASPVSVMEAMACGLPVVVSRIGGTPDMISDGVDGLLVEQSDVAGLAAAIERLARDRHLRERLGGAARGRAETSFDSRASAGRLLAAIRELKPLQRAA